MPGDPMDDIELRSVQLHNPVSRTGSLTAITDQRKIVTDKGDLLVAVQGDTSKPAILTYHDLGLNCKFYFYFLSLLLKDKLPNKTPQVSLASSTIHRCEDCWRIFAFITLTLRDKKKMHRHFQKSEFLTLLTQKKKGFKHKIPVS